MDQPKKPARDIADLKARLGLAKPGAGGPAAGPAPAPPGAAPFVPGAPAPMPPGAVAPPGAAPARAVPVPPGVVAVPQPARRDDPFAGLRPQGGGTFDLGPDDGSPVENVRQKGGKGSLVISVILLGVGLGVGIGFGGAAVGRRAYNSANNAAKLIQAELKTISKNVSEIGDSVARSAQRAAKTGDPFAYDYGLVEELEKLDLTQRPNTTRIFKADYSRLEDLAVDRLMAYYYDAHALYREAEEHVRKTKNDREALEAFAKKQAETQKGANYGIVFGSTGQLLYANMVEMGAPVCAGGGSECGASEIEAFEIRAGVGSSWAKRKVGNKLETGNVVPIKPTELFDAVMTGSPEQVRMAEYRERMATMSRLVTSLKQTQKELVEAVDKAASRPDLFAL